MPAGTETHYAGGCLCGAVRFAIVGRPHLMEYCHCQTCRKSAGAPVMAWLGIAADRFEWVCGAPRFHASSPGVERGFCGACGTSITISSAAFADDIYVSVAATDEAALFHPEVHIWREHRLPWFDTADGLPRYTRFKSDGMLEE